MPDVSGTPTGVSGTPVDVSTTKVVQPPQVVDLSKTFLVVLRFASAIVAFGLAALCLVYLPDPTVKIAATAILGASALAVEKYLTT
jgi:hypothetical protein